jgi:dihydrofolate reductase
MLVSVIVAVSDGGVIGRAGALPWRLSADLRRFRRLTSGHAIVMGRKTYESIGRPLPDRTSIVVTRNAEYRPPGVQVAASLPAALELAAAAERAAAARRLSSGEASSASDEEAFVIGGGELYRHAMPLADRLYLTLVHANVEGDVFFPPVDPAQWDPIERSDHGADEKNAFAYSFLRYNRRR